MASSRIGEISTLLQEGRVLEAKGLIRAIPGTRLTREQRRELAYLANQALLHKKALQLLHQAVRVSKGGTDLEKAEYARALIGIEATNEALQLLATIDIRKAPIIIPIIAFAHFRRWDWNAAVPLLESALRLGRLPRDIELQAKVRFALALANGPRLLEQGIKVAKQAMEAMGPDTSRRVQWEGWHTRAEIHFLRREWKEARSSIARMEDLYPGDSESALALFALKWRALVALYSEQASGQAEARRRLAAVKHGFARLGAWEQIRSCDYHEALYFREERQLQLLFFGTPYPAFRAKLLRELGRDESDFPGQFALRIGPRGTRDVFDIASGVCSTSSARLKPGSAPQRLLQALTADFHASPKVVVLHEALYPGEHFNPLSSPVRVRQVMKRLRQWLSQARFPLRIHEQDDAYRLESDKPVELLIPKHYSRSPMHMRHSELKASFGKNAFGAAELEALFQISRSSTHNLLKTMLAAGLLSRSGKASSTRYRLKY